MLAVSVNSTYVPSQDSVNRILKGINSHRLTALTPIKQGAIPVDAMGALGQTPLVSACMASWPRCVATLLTLGADTRQQWHSLNLCAVTLLSMNVGSDSDISNAVKVLQLLYLRGGVRVQPSAEIPHALLSTARDRALSMGYLSLARALTQ